MNLSQNTTRTPSLYLVRLSPLSCLFMRYLFINSAKFFLDIEDN
jgi:hypothetical protein